MGKSNEKVVRCITCNNYYRIEIPRGISPRTSMFRCPRGHFSQFEFEELLIVDADLVGTIFAPIERSEPDGLLESELKWIAKQAAKLYDCGFFAQKLGDESPIPSLDLSDIQHPDTAGMLYDSRGREFKLAISPNGLSYYILIKEEKE